MLLGVGLGLMGGLAAGLGGLISALRYDLEEARSHNFAPAVHDGIARCQHHCRQRQWQRQLLEKEWAGVPDRALTQARPGNQLQPTDTSLSPAEEPEERKSCLVEGVTEETTGNPFQALLAQFRRK